MNNGIVSFYKGKKIFVTGHTGFKGSWLCRILNMAGAEVTGYSLEPNTVPSLYYLSEIGKDNNITSVIGDVRDYSRLKYAFDKAKPEIIIHMAAQPIVRESYQNPRYTYETNVMGTVNILECVRNTDCTKSFLNVTTDKVYENKGWEWGYREIDQLDGYDPYSNSKSCSELVAHSYANSFLKGKGVAVSTARAGNVIGGGDFAKDRIIPDCVRAVENGKEIIVRNPYSVRPYQHVLEPLFAYLLITKMQYEDNRNQGWYNVGPNESDCVTTGELTTMFCKKWQNIKWISKSDGGPQEASSMKLDCSKIKKSLGWKPLLHIDEAIEMTVEWSKCYLNGQSVAEIMDKQIYDYINKRENK